MGLSFDKNSWGKSFGIKSDRIILAISRYNNEKKLGESK
jgi:hypothetical protein